MVYANSVFDVGDTPVLRLRVFDAAGDTFTLDARVVRSLRVRSDLNPETVCIAGLAFMEPDRDPQRAVIHRLVALCEASVPEHLSHLAIRPVARDSRKAADLEHRISTLETILKDVREAIDALKHAGRMQGQLDHLTGRRGHR
jgi:hypothetical protein